MEDKRVAMALLISILIIMFYNQVVNPPQPPVQRAASDIAQTESAGSIPATVIAPPAATVESSGIKTIEPAAPSLSPPVANTAEDTETAPKISASVDKILDSGITVINTEKVIMSLSSLGGRIVSLRLKNFGTSLEDDTPVELISAEDGIFPLGVYFENLSDKDVNYKVVGASAQPNLLRNYTVGSGTPFTIKLEGTLKDDVTLTKTLRIVPDSYLFDVKISTSRPSNDGSPVWLEWSEFLDSDAPDSRYNTKSFSLFDNSDSLDREPATKIETIAQSYSLKWAALGNNYFTAAIIPKTRGTNINITKAGNTVLFRALGKESGGEFSIYAGAKLRKEFEKTGYKLEKTIDLGFFAFIGQPLLKLLHHLYEMLGNYGLAIILLTLLIKLALLPLTRKSFESMRKMQKLQPEMTALRSRIKDPTQLNQEIMGLYKKRGVNPLGGCLPMVLQLPVFLGMYNALRVSIDLRHADYALWITDLSAPESLMLFGIPVPVMIILMGISMLATQLTTPTNMDPSQKKMMLIMPVMFTGMFIIMPFPSGLVLYWLVNNVVSIVQQTAMRSEKNISPIYATVVGGAGIFAFGFIMTLL